MSAGFIMSKLITCRLYSLPFQSFGIHSFHSVCANQLAIRCRTSLQNETEKPVYTFKSRRGGPYYRKQLPTAPVTNIGSIVSFLQSNSSLSQVGWLTLSFAVC